MVPCVTAGTVSCRQASRVVPAFSFEDSRGKEGSTEHYHRTGNYQQRPASCAAASPALGSRRGCLARVSTHSQALSRAISPQYTCTVISVSRAKIPIDVCLRSLRCETSVANIRESAPPACLVGIHTLVESLLASRDNRKAVLCIKHRSHSAQQHHRFDVSRLLSITELMF